MPRQSKRKVKPVLTDDFDNKLQRQSENDLAGNPVSETTSSDIKFESEDGTDTFVLIPKSTSPRRWAFPAMLFEDGQREQSHHHPRIFSWGSKHDVQKLKENVEKSDRRSEDYLLARAANLGELETVIESLKKTLAADEIQKEGNLKVAADVAMRYTELDIYRHWMETLFVHLQASVETAGLDRNVASLWMILKIWLARKATAPPTTAATTTKALNFLNIFPDKQSALGDVKAWINLYLTKLNSGPAQCGVWMENVIWSGYHIWTLSQVELSTHLSSWGCGALENELLSKEIIYARRMMRTRERGFLLGFVWGLIDGEQDDVQLAWKVFKTMVHLIHLNVMVYIMWKMWHDWY